MHIRAHRLVHILRKVGQNIRMPIIQTKYLFEELKNREQLACDLVQSIFPWTPPEAIQYELLQQGLLQNGKLTLSLDVWQILDQQLNELRRAWKGPDIAVYIFPITSGFVKNGVAYREGIFLFVSTRLTIKELHALFAHEYHHVCRRLHLQDPPTLMDSLIMEGLAEDAVETLFGVHALSSWTQRYSLQEVQNYWDSHFINVLYQKGLTLHKPYLFGDNHLGLPPWIGYCTGYRIVQAFKQNHGPIGLKELMHMRTETIIDGAVFKRNN